MKPRRLTFALLTLALITLTALAAPPARSASRPAASKRSASKPSASKPPASKPPASKPPAAVPGGFVGMNADGPIVDSPSVNLGRQLSKMVASGVESVRFVFSWAAAQPQPDGPISFTATDRVVGPAAQRGLTVLPVVLYAPEWDAAPHSPATYARPDRFGPYAAYVKALVGRYGPHGSYWREHRGLPKQPIRMWQIWNEPNFLYFWPTAPFAPSYVGLVRAAHAAIKQADPGAQVVLAGMPNFAWRTLAQIYAVKGARKTFDVVAAHSYSEQPAHVIDFLRRMRAVMARNGDSGKPLVATEMGWSSSFGQHPGDNFCCQTTERGQARKVRKLLPLLGSHRKQMHLIGFYYYTWLTQQYAGAPSFNFAGLFNLAGGAIVRKPVFDEFRRGALALEQCRRKSRIATRCRTPR